MNNRCTAITKSGEVCRNFALHDEDKCITHSQSPTAKKARSRRKILTRQEMVLELQRRLRIVKRLEGNDLEVSREVRRILDQIARLQGITAPERGEEATQKGQPFEKKVEEAMRKIDDGEEEGEE